MISGILVKIFRRLLLSQFKDIKHGCIILNEGKERIVFGDENSQLKSKNMHYLKNIARWRKVARHLKEIIYTLDYETNNTSHRKVRLNKIVGDT